MPSDSSRGKSFRMGKPVDALFWCGLQNSAGAARYNTRAGEIQGTRLTRPPRASDWALLTTLGGMMARGDDPLALIADRCHALGRHAWLSFRFNDAHHAYSGVAPENSKTTQLYIDRPDLRIGAEHGWKPGYAERQWNYLEPEVSDRVDAPLSEAYLECDVEGIALDFVELVVRFQRRPGGRR